MSGRSGLSVAAGLWGVAFIALGMAAFTTNANAAGVVAIACVGHAYTGLALLIDRADRDAVRSPAGRSTTILFLGVPLAIESVAALVSLAFAERDLALWFALGASFPASGIAVTRQRVPGDNVLACQLFFHTVFLAPLLAALPIFLLDLGTPAGATEGSLGRASMRLVIMVFCLVAIPLLVVSLATVLTYNVTRPKGDRDLPWAIMTAHQGLFVVMVFRWACNGL